jgi:hypothetical protein
VAPPPDINGWWRGQARLWLALLFLFVGAGVSRLGAQTGSAAALKPEEVKALFLIQFAELTTWPAEGPAAAGGKVVIGFVQAPEVMAATVRLLKGGAEERFELRKVDGAAEAGPCRIIYFGGTDGAAGELLRGLRGRPVLTVGEELAFVRAAGIIGFTLVPSGAATVTRYFVNVPAMDAAGVRLDTRIIGRALEWRKERP